LSRAVLSEHGDDGTCVEVERDVGEDVGGRARVPEGDVAECDAGVESSRYRSRRVAVWRRCIGVFLEPEISFDGARVADDAVDHFEDGDDLAVELRGQRDGENDVAGGGASGGGALDGN